LLKIQSGCSVSDCIRVADMKVEPQGSKARGKSDLMDALSRLTGNDEVRPCPGCAHRCPTCGSGNCTCQCNARCPKVPEVLSSDPKRFPIEAGVLPLVFALNRAKLAVPCWSCEGHRDHLGNLHKLPQVWFYVPSTAIPGLLAHYLWSLWFSGRLENKWSVLVIASDNRLDTTYAVQPAENPELRLESLRRDVETIAEWMIEETKQIAEEALRHADCMAGHPVKKLCAGDDEFSPKEKVAPRP